MISPAVLARLSAKSMGLICFRGYFVVKAIQLNLVAIKRCDATTKTNYHGPKYDLIPSMMALKILLKK
jgi:hypothetical protein